MDITIQTDIDTEAYMKQLGTWWNDAMYNDETGIGKNRILDALYPLGYSDNQHDKVFETVEKIGNGIKAGKQKIGKPYQYLRKCLNRN